MHIALPEATIELRNRLRRRLETLLTPALCDELAQLEAGEGGPLHRSAIKALADEGWLGFGWPTEYGGRGHCAVDQFVFFDELQRAGFPFPILSLTTVGPTLMRFGTDAQKRRFLPAILRAEADFAIGYTEPGAGTDLAGLKTTARRDGDVYVINGRKMWSSHAMHADFLWLAVRTDPAAERHRGLSVMIVPRDATGVSVTPIRTLGDNNTAAVYLDEVRVPVDHRVGDEHGGWQIITNQLNHERVAIASPGHLSVFVDAVLGWALSTPHPAGGVYFDHSSVRLPIAEVVAGLELLRLQNWRQAWAIDGDCLEAADASAVKVHSSELFQRAYRTLMEVIGPAAALRRDAHGAFLAAHAERYYRSLLPFTFGGGTNEVQRDMIAMMGGGLTRTGYGQARGRQ